MKHRPRVFSAALSRAERIVYGTVALVFIGAFLAAMWPVYPLLSRIRPFVLGVPFSLFYLVVLVLVCFLALLALYSWENRHGKLQ